MLVVADASPLHYVVLMQQDTLLPTLYERMVIPPPFMGNCNGRTPRPLCGSGSPIPPPG